MRLDSLDADILRAIEPEIHRAAEAVGRSGTATPGRLVERVEPDAAGRRVVRSYGDPAAWMRHFMRGGQRGRFIRPEAA